MSSTDCSLYPSTHTSSGHPPPWTANSLYYCSRAILLFSNKLIYACGGWLELGWGGIAASEKQHSLLSLP